MRDECCAGFVFGKKSKMAAPITDSKYQRSRCSSMVQRAEFDGYAKHSKCIVYNISQTCKHVGLLALSI